jgi:tetratricopeptide (TPR) repeat protein
MNAQPLMEQNYKQGLEFAKSGNYVEAITSFTKAIEVQPLDAYAWYNRAMAKNMIGEYEDAINDFTTCIGLSRGYEKVWYNRGITKMYVGLFDGALFDLNQALQIQRNYPEAYYHRASIYELKGLYNFACTDYQNAKAIGYNVPREKLDACKDTLYQGFVKNPILSLRSSNRKKKYGVSKKHPILVGSIFNMQRYLLLLRSPENKYLPYEILENGEITSVKISYSVEGKPKVKTLFFDCAHRGDVHIIKGFKTFGTTSGSNPP